MSAVCSVRPCTWDGQVKSDVQHLDSFMGEGCCCCFRQTQLHVRNLQVAGDVAAGPVRDVVRFFAVTSHRSTFPVVDIASHKMHRPATNTDAEPGRQPTVIHNHRCFIYSSKMCNDSHPPLECPTWPKIAHRLCTGICLSWQRSACKNQFSCATPPP